MKRSLLLSISLIFCFACSRPAPTLEGIDLDAWKNDFKGCLKSRLPFVDTLRFQREKLKGLSERDLISVLGRPDRNDLSQRHEKYYYYFISPGPGCAEADSVELALIVRFNATGVSKEVVIE